MNLVARMDVETAEKWGEITRRIPALNFNADWSVRVIPPFGGAMVRMLIEKGGKKVSVYLDFYDNLGAVGEPYWEIYPYQGDVGRFPIDETGMLIDAISEVLD